MLSIHIFRRCSKVEFHYTVLFYDFIYRKVEVWTSLNQVWWRMKRRPRRRNLKNSRLFAKCRGMLPDKSAKFPNMLPKLCWKPPESSRRLEPAAVAGFFVALEGAPRHWIGSNTSVNGHPQLWSIMYIELCSTNLLQNESEGLSYDFFFKGEHHENISANPIPKW